VMASAPPTALLVVATVMAGAGSIGTQIIVFGYVATHYETAVRATALGLTTGIGRLGAVSGPLVGGWLLANNFGNAWTFGFFGATAVIGGIACVLVPRRRRATVEDGNEPALSSAASS
jgi:AAHS family benzoate transporter-like MFS transporter